MKTLIDAYVVEWKENGKLVVDTTPRTEFEALDFAVKKSTQLKGIPAWIKKSGYLVPHQMSKDTPATKERALEDSISKK